MISYQPTIPVICSNGGITITVSGASTYLWSPSSELSSTIGSSVFANPPVATTYTVTGTDVNGCSASTSIPVTLHTPPVVTLGNYNTVCVNTSPFALTGGSPSGGIYSGPGVSGGIFNPSTAGAGTHTITYTYTDANGCSAAASSAIIVKAIPPAAIFPSGSLSLCTGSTLTLAATPGYNYSWSTGATTSFIPVSSAGNYSVSVSDANGCSASSSPVNVTVNANQLIIPLFVETMGNPTANTAIGTWEANNGFDNISLTMSGSGEVRNTSVSSGYAGASGSGNVFLTNTAGRNFIISRINTNGLSNLY